MFSCASQWPSSPLVRASRYATVNFSTRFRPTRPLQEVRFEDYLKSYQTTGGPPPPVPQQPIEDFQRAALGLPPLFKPQTTAGSTALTRTPTVLIDSVSVPRIVDPTQLPKGQEFSVTTNTNEKFQSIVAMSQYEFFSPEVRVLCPSLTRLCVLTTA